LEVLADPFHLFIQKSSRNFAPRTKQAQLVAQMNREKKKIKRKLLNIMSSSQMSEEANDRVGTSIAIPITITVNSMILSWT
jgi:hypothetical protein